jgi:hypothetical protein
MYLHQKATEGAVGAGRAVGAAAERGVNAVENGVVGAGRAIGRGAQAVGGAVSSGAHRAASWVESLF